MLHHIPLEASVSPLLAPHPADFPSENLRWARGAIAALGVATALAGLYLVASVAASRLAASYQPLVRTDDQALHAVAAAANRAHDEHRAAILKCRSVAPGLRARCDAAAAQDILVPVPD